MTVEAETLKDIHRQVLEFIEEYDNDSDLEKVLDFLESAIEGRNRCVSTVLVTVTYSVDVLHKVNADESDICSAAEEWVSDWGSSPDDIDFDIDFDNRSETYTGSGSYDTEA